MNMQIAHRVAFASQGFWYRGCDFEMVAELPRAAGQATCIIAFGTTAASPFCGIFGTCVTMERQLSLSSAGLTIVVVSLTRLSFSKKPIVNSV